MYSMLNQNIQCVFKQDSPGLTMCVMGDCLHIAHSNSVNTDGVELHFSDIECFSNIPEPTDTVREFAVKLGEKCDGTCSNSKICKCVNDSSMICLPKVFYTIIPGFRPQPHKGLEYGDVSGEIKTKNHSYEMKGIIKKNTCQGLFGTITDESIISKLDKVKVARYKKLKLQIAKLMQELDPLEEQIKDDFLYIFYSNIY